MTSKTHAEAERDAKRYLPKIFNSTAYIKGKFKPDQSWAGDSIRDVQSLMKRVVTMEGSRDMSAQLFVSLCRALQIPARLVVSLQPLDWRFAGGTKIGDEDTDGDGNATNASAGSSTKKPAKKKQPTKKKGQSGTAKLLKKAGVSSMTNEADWKKMKLRTLTTNVTSGESEVEMEAIIVPSSAKVNGKGSSSRAGSASASSAAGGFVRGKSETESEGERLRHRKVPVKLRNTKVKVRDIERSPSPGLSIFFILYS